LSVETNVTETFETKPLSVAQFMKPVVQIAVMMTVIVSVILTLFAWPLANAKPSHVPIGLVGSAAAISGVKAGFEQQSPGAFDIVTFANRDAAAEAIGKREVYGALVLTDQPEVLTASAASASITQILNQLAVSFAHQAMTNQGTQVLEIPVLDLAALPGSDPRGLGLNAGALPLVIAGIVAALLATIRLRRISQRFALIGLVSITASLAMNSILHLWLGSLVGNFWLETLVIAVSIVAVASTLLGLATWLGRIGLVAGIVFIFLIGNPLSGGGIPVEYYPAGLGSFGQLLPLGAELNLLKRISFFPDADTFQQWFTLLSWVGFGLLAMGSGYFRRGIATLKPSDNLVIE
jgi:hypothetical protein